MDVGAGADRRTVREEFTLNTITSIATVATDRAARYDNQLASHLSRRSVTRWEASTGTGTLEMGDGAAHAEFVSTPQALVFTLSTAPDNADLYEDVIGRAVSHGLESRADSADDD